jgi:ariadne-1
LTQPKLLCIRCSQEIQTEKLFHLLNSEDGEKIASLLTNRFLAKESLVYCPNPRCSLPFYLEGRDCSTQCPECAEEICSKCLKSDHKGECVPDELEEMAKAYVASVKGMQCLSCKFFIEKNDGCDHMTCRCGYEFCLKCKHEYSVCECRVQIQLLQNHTE